MKNSVLKNQMLLAFAVLLAHHSFSQGTTTSTISGIVVNEKKEPLAGATVRIVNEQTGSKYGTAADENGTFRVFNLEVGGPYNAVVNSIGFKEHIEPNIYLKLGEVYRLTVELSEESKLLGEVTVTHTRENGGKASSVGTNIDNLTLNKLPTVNRDLTDYTRLDPRASLRLHKDGNSVSFAGVSNRYNAIFIDGAVNNDLVGLSQSGTNGGQAGISPISPDAIKEIQIAVAPYDVTLGGFAGGAINAVTRSGTNTLEGSAYYFLRNESLAGKTPTNNNSAKREKLPEFTAQTYGFRIGGPVVKDKLFYFINTELQSNVTPYVLPSYNGRSSFAALDAIAAKLKNEYGYDPGSYRNNTAKLQGQKVIAKINWNINNSHKLSFRHSYVRGGMTGKLTSDPSNLYFLNTGVNFPSVTNSSALELHSQLGNSKSNKLIVGYTSVDDNRSITGEPFPNIVINDGGANINLGSDPFSFSNHTQQRVLSITDNFTLSKNKHTFTFGTHNEFYKVKGNFLPFHPAQYSYFSVDKFFANEAYQYLYGHTVGNKEFGDDAVSASVNYNASQLAFYAQDEFQVSDRFNVTGGLRLDIPILEDYTPFINTDFNVNTIPKITAAGYDLKGAEASKLSIARLLISPRLGFEYDLDKERTSKVSGGVGVFTSRVPFTLIDGAYLNNGFSTGFDVNFNPKGRGAVGAGGIPFVADYRKQPFTDKSPSGDIDVLAKNFKFPRVLKASLSYEKKYKGIFGMVSFQYTKILQNFFIENVNAVKNPIANLTGSPDNRPIFSGASVEPTYKYITLISNTNKGHTASTSIQLQKQVIKGLTTSISYNYTVAMSVYDGNRSITTNWKELPNVNGRNNSGDAQLSAFSSGHRIVGLVSYEKRFQHIGTSVSLFYNGQTGERYSYVYNDAGKLNKDNPNGTESRNLIYIPKGRNEITLVDKDLNGDNKIGVGETAAEQWNALNNFIDGDPYLSKNRGGYAKRNGAATPFESILDLKLEVSVFTKRPTRTHELKFSLDIFNFTNFINKNWGRRYFVGDANYRLINFEGFRPYNTTPTFSFKAPASGAPWNINDFGVNSARWQAQIGVRYSF